MVAPRQTSDEVRTMLDDYAQTGMMPKWNLGGGESYVMVGDPADGIIADAYAFGARDFDVRQALSDMIHEATVPNQIRPALTQFMKDGYIPYNEQYSCCNFYGSVSTQQEYDTADYAIASLANSLGDRADYTRFASIANNWENVYNAGTGYLQAKLANGQFLGGYNPATSNGFVEATSAQYTPMINFNLKAMIAAKGGDAAYNAYLDGMLSNLPNPSNVQADLSNEPSIEIPWEYDYTGEPYKTQGIVREAQQQLYFNAPVGQDGNDDLGEMSSWYVWSELGMYPEVAGTDQLVLGSPVFNRTVIHLGSGRAVTIDAPKAAPNAPYVKGLTVNGRAETNDWLTFGQLFRGATLNYDLSTTPNKAWASSAKHEPGSDSLGENTAFTSVTPGKGLFLTPGASGGANVQLTNIGTAPISAHWTATASTGVTLATTSGTVSAKAGGTGTAPITVKADSNSDGVFTVKVTYTTSARGVRLNPAYLTVIVAKPGELWPYFTNAGIAHDGVASAANFDGDGWAYSANALAAAGVVAGGTVTADGVHYAWPNLPDGQLDNIEANGQTIPLVLPAGATKLGLIGSAANAGASGASGDLVVHYTDGSSQSFPVALSDWTLGAGAYQPLPDETTVAKTPYRDATNGGNQQVTTYLFATDVQLAAGKTVSSVTLPESSGGDMHVFTIGNNG
jgi:hypothetical protein